MPEGSDTNGIGNFLPTIAFRIFCPDVPFEAKNRSKDLPHLISFNLIVYRCERNFGRFVENSCQIVFFRVYATLGVPARFYRLIVSGSKKASALETT
jgi:hypothetical protein